MNLLQATAVTGADACRHCMQVLENIVSFFVGKISALVGKIDAVARPSWWPFDWGKHIPQDRRPKSPQASSMRGASRRFKISHAEARNRPLRVGATHREATKPSEASAERS